MGEAKKHCFKLNFADNVMTYFKGSEITSDGGLLAIRELDHSKLMENIRDLCPASG